MAVRVDVRYEGQLRCVAQHGPSGARFETDAPTDNQGRGESFSPTDLVGTALGSCMLTIMGIAARERGWAIEGASVEVTKNMGAEPRRHIAGLDAVVRLPESLDERARTVLEQAAVTCPVHVSIEGSIPLDVRFTYD